MVHRKKIALGLTILTVQQGLQDEDPIPIYTYLDMSSIHRSPEPDNRNIENLLRGFISKCKYTV